jgi:hypothetical protein
MQQPDNQNKVMGMDQDKVLKMMKLAQLLQGKAKKALTPAQLLDLQQKRARKKVNRKKAKLARRQNLKNRKCA